MSEYQRTLWYIQHRIEYLENQQKKLKGTLEQSDLTELSLDELAIFMENKGALKELRKLLEHMEKY